MSTKKQTLSAFCYLEHSMPIYFGAGPTHLPIFRTLWGTGLPATQDTRAFLGVDSAPSCGHSSLDWGWAVVIKYVKEPQSGLEEVAAKAKSSVLGILFLTGNA